MDLRETQAPLKERYRAEPDAAHITLKSDGSATGEPISCSGDLLLGALAACAQLTCQMVATAMGLPVESVQAHVEGDLDLRGTLGLSRDVTAGFESIRLRIDVSAPDATD